MILLTKEILKKLPKLYETENVKLEDKKIICKLFTPWSNWTWYISEYCREEQLFFAYCCGHDKEWGYVSLEELQSLKHWSGLRVERDRHFKECKFSELKEA